MKTFISSSSCDDPLESQVKEVILACEKANTGKIGKTCLDTSLLEMLPMLDDRVADLQCAKGAMKEFTVWTKARNQGKSTGNTKGPGTKMHAAIEALEKRQISCPMWIRTVQLTLKIEEGIQHLDNTQDIVSELKTEKLLQILSPCTVSNIDVAAQHFESLFSYVSLGPNVLNKKSDFKAPAVAMLTAIKSQRDQYSILEGFDLDLSATLIFLTPGVASQEDLVVTSEFILNKCKAKDPYWLRVSTSVGGKILMEDFIKTKGALDTKTSEQKNLNAFTEVASALLAQAGSSDCDKAALIFA